MGLPAGPDVFCLGRLQAFVSFWLVQTFEVLTPDPTPEFLKMQSVEGFGDPAGLGECELKKKRGDGFLCYRTC